MDIQDYKPPAGTEDFPFVYAFDASDLTDGITYQNIQIQSQGDSEFILRAIRGLPTCLATGQNGGRFGYRNNDHRYTNSNESSGMVPGVNEPVLPEKRYPIGSSILLDLYNVLRDFTVCGGTPIYNSQAAFVGVKRFPAGSGFAYSTPYKYRRIPQTYTFPFTIDWAHFSSGSVVAQPHRFSFLTANYDFELLGIRIAQPNSVGPLITNDFQLTLFDQRRFATSSLPVNQGYLNSARATPQTAPPFRSAFPCPPLVYPYQGQIQFDITSMLCSTALPQNYVIDFVGCWRIPV